MASRPVSDGSTVLQIVRRIKAPRERIFAAWTDADSLKQWWSTSTHRTTHVELDPREGGHYRIEMQTPDGLAHAITGIYERVSPPSQLIYSWQVEGMGLDGIVSRVTIDFIAHDDQTELIITHEGIPDPAIRENHHAGWLQILDSLLAYL